MYLKAQQVIWALHNRYPKYDAWCAEIATILKVHKNLIQHAL